MRRMSIVMLLVAIVLLLSCSEPPTPVMERIIERVIEVTVEVTRPCPTAAPHIIEVTPPCPTATVVLIYVPREVVVEKMVVETVEVLVVVTATPTPTTR